MSDTQESVIDVRSWEEPLGEQQLSRIEALLPDWIPQQRWYRAKARTISGLHVDDSVPAKCPGTFTTIVRIEYKDGETDTYLLPLAMVERSSELAAADVLAQVRDQSGAQRVLVNALAQADFRMSLLDAIACDDVFEGVNGSLVTRRTNAFDRQCGQAVPELTSKVSRAEQSNSSIIFGDQYILKVFRKLEEGINPDIEIGRFLTDQEFASTPQVLGTVEYLPKHSESGEPPAPMYAAILQKFVANQGDAWKFTLDSLTGFFERALPNGDAPALPGTHPFELMKQQLPPAARQTIGDYVESARLLGTRTAQMHAALASSETHPDFAPQSFARESLPSLRAEMVHEADRAFGLLRDKQSSLKGEAAISAQRLLAAEADVRSRFDLLNDRDLSALVIRHHGDYHLGQVLYTGSDFTIIDFEGEPARPLSQRRQRAFAMRDVAGMVRSFSYAGFAALFGQVPGVKVDDANYQRIENWAAFWGAWVSAEYLRAYFLEAEGKPFVSTSEGERKLLFDVFALQKALYEVAYELNNRPDWVQIPLRGILSLIA